MSLMKSVLSLAVLAAASDVCSAAYTYTWNNVARADNAGVALDWGLASNWTKPAPDPDPALPPADLPDSTGTAYFNAGFSSTHDRWLALNGDRTIASISAISSGAVAARSFVLTPGTGGILTINTGNITLDGNGINGGKPLSFANITVQIGDGETPVTNAVWETKNSHASPGTVQFGALRGIAGTVVTVKGNVAPAWNASSNDYHGTIVLQQTTGTAGVNTTVNASNAFGGAGSLLVIDNPQRSQFLFTPGSSGLSTSHAMDIQVGTLANPNSELTLAAGNNVAGDPLSTITLNGKLTGSGTLVVGKLGSASTQYLNTRVIMNGTGHTLSGKVTVDMGAHLNVGGNWTNAGDISVVRGVLSGSGNIGMGEGNSVTVALASSTANAFAAIAPGDVGVVGTMTLGTEGNSNSVNFNRSNNTARYTQLMIDLDGNTSDKLVVNGNLTIGGGTGAGGTGSVHLVLNELSTPTAGEYVIASWTGSLTGTFGMVEGLPSGYTLEYATNQLRLVNPAAIPEPASMAGGLMLMAGLLTRRRARSGGAA